jgi:undecaprenyl-diphosphatase
MLRGVVGRDREGRDLVLALVVAFIPAALVGVVFEQPIKDHLFGAWPVVAAWIVGGVAILWFHRVGLDVPRRGNPLSWLTLRGALIIGLAQVLALWPGTSRSLVTILGGLWVGLSLPAAVEFAFLLGLATLGAATVYETAKNGSEMFNTFGVVDPLIGVVVAFVSAVVAVKWMIGYLQRHDLRIFGWYRIGIGVVVAALLGTGLL